jgi:translocation and assembly module TamB
MARLRRRLLIAGLAVLVALMALAAIAVRLGPMTPAGRALIENGWNGLKVGRVGYLRIQGLGGDPWGRFTLGRLTIADRRGVWLEVREARVRWDPLDLLARRAHVSMLTAERVTVFRRPLLGAPETPNPLPVSIQIDALSTQVELTPAAALRRGVYDLRGGVRFERSGPARVDVTAASVLHAGDFLEVHFDLTRAKAFKLQARGSEAKGGALAGALGLPADQPFDLAANVDGSVEAGRFSVLTRVGGATPVAAAGAWNGEGGWAEGRVQVSASSLLSGYQKMIGPQLHARISGRRAPDGLYDLTLAAESANLTLAARGQADLGQMRTGPHGVAVDLHVADLAPIMPAPRMGPGEFKGGLGGDQSHWVLSGAASIERLGDPQFSVAKLAGPVRLESTGQEVSIRASVTGEGGAGRSLTAALLGARPRASTQVTLLADRRVLIRTLTLDGAGLRVAAAGNIGLLGALSFKGDATVTNMAAAHAGAHGAVKVAWTASQASSGRPWSFTFDARGQTFGAGLGEVDRLLGATPRIRAQGDFQDGVVKIAAATVDGAAGSLSTAGLIGPAGALRLKLDWRAQGPFVIGPLEIAGAAKGTGAVTGDLASPKADLLADFSAIDAPYLPLRDAHVVLSFQGGPQGSAGHLAISAVSQYGPARGAAGFRFAAGGLDLTGLDVNAGGVTALGALSLRANAPSSADLTLAVGPGAILTQGTATGRVKIVQGSGAARAILGIKASDAVLRGSGVAVHILTLTADGPLSRLPYQAKAEGAASGGPWRIAGSGLLGESAGVLNIDFTGAGRVGRADLKTLEPVEFHAGPHGRSARARLSLGAGRADIDVSESGGAMNVKANLADVSLALLNEDYIGRIDANVALAGHGPGLTGQLQARISGAGGRDLRGAAPISGLIDANLGAASMTITASVTDGKGMKAHGEVTLPTEASASPFRIAINRKRPLHGRFDIDGELRPLWDLTYGGETSLGGRLIAAGTIQGTLADPQAVGTASLDDGRFQDATTGLKLQNVSLRAALSGAAIDISAFTGGDGGKGSVNGSGRIDLTREGASSFKLNLNGFRLIDNDLGQATASGQVRVNRDAAGKVQLSGRLEIDRAVMAPNPPTPSGVVPMDVVEVNRPYTADEHAGVVAKPQAPVGLDVGLKAPGGVFIKGRGINLELSLEAHVGGNTDAPILTGTARVARGDYNFAGKRFQIGDRGVIYLGSTPQTIRLDLTATRDDPSLTAVIRIQGTAAKPIITLSSTPTLPQDEVLSQLLFGASQSQLSPIEAAQLASALAGLAGTGGLDVIGGLRNFAHLDRLAFGSSATTGTTVSGGKYIRDNVYLELTGGGREGSAAQVEWRVKKHLSLLARMTSQSDSQLSVRWRKDY